MKSASLFVGEANTNDLMETELISRWQRVLNSVPKGTMGGHFGYSLNQLQYLGLIIQQVLKAKEATLQVYFYYVILYWFQFICIF